MKYMYSGPIDDALTIYLVDRTHLGENSHSETIDEQSNIIADYDDNHIILALEFLDASRILA